MKHEQTVVSLSLFYSYAHEDELLRQQLEKHLSLLRRQEVISEWYDREILPGGEWMKEVDEHLEMASLILLLISPDFLSSDYCYDIEMHRALERHKRGEARIIPIILKPCDWRHAPFADLQCLPRDGKPVTMWSNQDEAFDTVTQELRRVIEQQVSSAHPSLPLSSSARENRLSLLKRVRQMWITGVLEQSLHQGALIVLDLQEQPDALANPWRLQVQETNLPPRPLPTGTTIAQVYDAADGELLILGKPGAGKTTLLLELARTFLTRAEQNEGHPLPIVFNLSSWAQKRFSLQDWFVEELQIRYRVPPRIGRVWVATHQVLPLLDGLDEVAEGHRLACVQAINAYHEEQLNRSFVVCSRAAEYYAQLTRLQMNKAIMIQPLTTQQVEQYLSSSQGNLEGVRHLLQHDDVVRELATTPLMLNVITLAYADSNTLSILQQTGDSREAAQPSIFAAYVHRMLHHRGVLRTGTEQQMRQWLTFLAVQLQKHSQTMFFLEQIQSEWLPEGRERLIYHLLTGPAIGLIFGILSGLLMLLAFGWDARLCLLFGLIFALLYGQLFLLGFDLESGVLERNAYILLNQKRVRSSLRNGLVFLLIFVGPFALAIKFVSALFLGLIFVPLFGLLLILFSMLQTNALEKQIRTQPNQGVHSSLKISLVFGLLGMLIISALFGLLSGLLGELLLGLRLGLVVGLLTGLLIGLAFGGLAAIQHIILRFFLWHSKCTLAPWKFVSFLNEATERLLLHKVGGGYMFIHRLLLDYFASLEKKDP